VSQRINSALIATLAVLLCSGCGQSSSDNKKTADTDQSTDEWRHFEKVRFGMEPYGDHTYAIIGVKKGWFKEVGIDLEYRCVKTDDVVPFLESETLDVASCPPAFLYSSHENSPDLITFVLGDLFKGFGIMAQPAGHYKSYKEFLKEGKPPAEAVKAAVGQMRGKTFAYPAETAIKPFIELALKNGGLKHDDFTALVLDDPLTINAMRQKRADFQVGGAPSRIVLQREGCNCILSSDDLAAAAKPSPDSPELASVLEDGWATKRKYFDAHHDTILRLASVNFRIIDFMNNHQQEALELHMPYLSQVTGQKFSPEEGAIIYNDLDPFIGFNDQKQWFHNPKSTYYYRNLNGSIVNNFKSQGIYKKKPPTVDDVIVAGAVYDELVGLRDKAAAELKQLRKAPPADEEGQDLGIKLAQTYFDQFDYLDAEKLASKLVEKMKH
jgi:ABC-type nitrate/sulfonate/bicarbonate transport system substrate-binding protein